MKKQKFKYKKKTGIISTYKNYYITQNDMTGDKSRDI